MRIRRHAHLASALPLSSCSLAASARAHLPAANLSVCELNQSPWDVIPFSPDSPLPNHFQGFWIAYQPAPEGRNERADCNGHNIGPAVKEEESADEKQLVPNVDLEPRQEVDEEEEKIMCRKTGSKGWKCTREAKKGHSLCDHHLALRQFYHSRARPKSGTAAGKSRRRGTAQQQGSSDFYYYSGFGPRWRKRRGNNEEEAPAQPLAFQSQSHSATSAAESSSADDASSDGGGEENGEERKNKETKRRKRMKSRSLMSLL